jgi:PAS domain S-box-containing protein
LIVTLKPSCESARLEALYRYDILDTESDPAFNDLARLASYICRTPIAAISFVDADRQWLKSSVGLDYKEASRKAAFCSHTILGTDIFTVEKADTDERFRNHPWVVEPPALRFYAGIPLTTPEGYAIGSLAVMDVAPRVLSQEQQSCLRTITNQVMAQLELRRASRSDSRHEKDRQKEIGDSVRGTLERTAHHTGQAYFASLVQELATTIGVDHAFCARVLPGGDRAQTMAVWSGGSAQPNFEYDLAGTPCAQVIANALCHYQTGVQELFPDDTLLKQMGVESYMGFPLLGSQQTPVGWIGIMGAGAIQTPARAEALLRLCGGKAGSELERMESEAARQKSQQLLRESEHRFRSIFEQAPVGIATIDSITGRFKSINAGYSRIIGYTEEEMRDRTFLDITHPDDLQADLAQMKRLLDGEIATFEMDKRLFRKNGNAIWVHLTCVPLWKKPSDPRLHLAIVQDISERKQAELMAQRFQSELTQQVEYRTNDLQQAQRLLQSVIDSTPDWIFVKDREHRFVLVNEAFAASQQLTPADMAGKLDSEFWPLEQCEGNPAKGIQGFHNDDRRAFAGELIHNPYDPASLHDGTLRIFDTYKGPWRDPNGQIGGVLCYARDVTAQRRAEEVIKQLNSELTIRVAERTAELAQANRMLEFDIANRKLAEKTLQSSEEKLRQTLQASHTGLWSWNTETNEVSFSKEWKRQLGCEETELEDTFETWETRLHPDDHARATQYVRDYLAKPAGDYQQEFRLRHKDGTYRWIEARASFAAESDGRAVRLLGSHTDITERKRAEEERTKQELLISLMLSTGPGCIKRVAADGTLLHMNPAGLEMIEACREDEAIGLLVFDLVLPEHRPAFISMHQDVINGASRTLQFEIQGLQGRRRWMETYAVPFRNPVTGSMEHLAVTHDITERKQVEQALKQSEERYRRLYDETPTMYFKLATDGTVLSVNRFGAAQLGYQVDELLGHSVLNVFHEEDKETASASLVECLATPEISRQWELRKVRKDGTIMWVQETAHVGQSSAGEAILLVTCDDITERKKAEEALRLTRFSIERAADAIFLVDATARILNVNEAASRLLGYSREELLSKTIHDIDSNFPSEAWPAHWTELKERGSFSFESMHGRKDGTVFPTEVTVNFLRHEGKEYNCAFMRDITERKQAEANLRLTQSAVDRAADMAYWITPDAKITYVNQAACDSLGYTKDELQSMTVADIDPDYQFDRWPGHWDELRQAGQLRFETRHKAKSGKIYPVEVVANFVSFGEREYNFAFTRDISLRKKAEAFAEGQRIVLDLIAKNAPLPDILSRLCLEIERQDNGMLCSILLLEGTKLRHAAGPSLPDEYNHAIDGVTIGPSVGSCGTAAYKNETVFVGDIATDPLWADYKDLALRHGLRACWSTPIHDAAGAPLGTFATYYPIPLMPTPTHIQLIDMSVYLAGIAIERHRAQEALRSSEERFRLVAEATQDILWDWDVPVNRHWWSPNAGKRFGGNLNDEPGIESWTTRLHPEDRDRVLALMEDILASGQRVFATEYRFRLADGSYGHFYDRGHLVLDHSGNPIRMIGAMIDITASKKAYASVQEAYRRLQEMANELQTVESNERRRLSRELHDEVGQLLTALKFDLESIKRKGIGKKKMTATQVTERLTRALHTTDLLFTRLRQIVRTLRPPVLEELGLKTALESMAADVQSRSSLICSVIVTGDSQPPGRASTRETAIYRIAQELLTNIIRHAQAMTASISLALTPDHWILTVKDDGIGFDSAVLPPDAGVGLRGIRERVEILGGRINVTSKPGTGTSAVIWIPVVEDPAPRTARKPGPAPSPRRRGRKQAHD